MASALRLQRIGEAEPAHRHVRSGSGARHSGRAGASTSWPSLIDRAIVRQQSEIPFGKDHGVAGRVYRLRSRHHAQLAREEPGERRLQLRIGEEEDALAGEFGR